MTRTILGIAVTSAILWGCARGGPTAAPDTQSFTRTMDATPGAVVTATQAEFSERKIAVATADQSKGEVISVPLDPMGEWGNMAPSDRVNCGTTDRADPDARMVMTM